jgi:hypothetical protein
VDTLNFFKDMRAISSFLEVTSPENYLPAPDDWLVVLTDVIGSTKAIEAGRYQDVNVLGASSLIAVINAIPSCSLPYIFGGDGATLLVPGRYRFVVENALRLAKDLARGTYGMDLRIGLVPVSDIRALGAEVLVAKFETGPAATIAMFSGGGCSLAESLVKSPSTSEKYAVKETIDLPSGTFEGLQCRWDAFPSSRDFVVSLLVSARAESDETSSQIYRDVIAKIDGILGNLSCPINRPQLETQLKSKWLRPGKQEAKVRTHGLSLGESLKYRAKVLFEMLAFKIMFRFKLKGEFFDPEKYLSELPGATDSKKFDDTFRIVFDATLQQNAEIDQYLLQEHNAGRIFYGKHVSESALMTCLVFNWDHHVHLVDGSHGGYTTAAKQLKEQIKKVAGLSEAKPKAS